MSLQPRIVIPPAFACVVAADLDRGIGRDGGLPWSRLRGDMEHFKQITSATRSVPVQPSTAVKGPGNAINAVVMGRRTWDSIPHRYRPLRGRLNIVVSGALRTLPSPALLANSLTAALAIATDAGVESIYVIGGGRLFEEAIRHPRCHFIYYTRVEGRFAADTFFPPFEDVFVREEISKARDESGIVYQIELWQRP